MIQENKYDYSVTFIIVGNQFCGKTSFINRAVNNNFLDDLSATMGFQLCLLNILESDKNFQLIIFDTAGEERFRNLTKNYYQVAACVMLAFSLNDRTSFEDIKNFWLEDAKDKIPQKALLILLGCKKDLERKVSFEEASTYAQENYMLYFETSAKENINIRKVFIESIRRIHKNINENYYGGDLKNNGITEKDQNINFNVSDPKKEARQKGCCI